jgi:hypothetical protein
MLIVFDASAKGETARLLEAKRIECSVALGCTVDDPQIWVAIHRLRDGP